MDIILNKHQSNLFVYFVVVLGLCPLFADFPLESPLYLLDIDIILTDTISNIHTFTPTNNKLTLTQQKG